MLVRLVVYNVRSFRAGVEAAAEAVGDRPDIALVQECGSRRALRRFARTLRLEAVSSHRPFSRIRNAVLFSPQWRLVDTRAVRLSREGRTLPRGYLVSRLRRGTATLTAVSAHLGLSPHERLDHAREVTDALAAYPGPLVLGVDLNEGPEGPAARWVAERLYDAHAVAGDGAGDTFPARAPTARIDFLFVSEGIRVLRCDVSAMPAAGGASDHRPVTAEIELGEP